MNWKIRKANNQRFIIDGINDEIGDIVFDGFCWEVRLPSMIGYRDANFDRCVGFVRGVEASK